MKRRIVAILLLACLVAGLIPMTSAAELRMEDCVNMDALVEHGISLFKRLEAGEKWNSVVNTSAGCVGMGIMGWIGSSALQLLKWCASPAKGGDPEYCQAILGDELYSEVVNAPVAVPGTLMPSWNYWRYRSFTSEELAAAKTLLGSDVGIRAQKALAKSYILTEAQHGWAAGVRTEAALLYYCSAENHYGEGNVKSFMTAVRNALGLPSNAIIPSLEVFHQGTVLAAQAGTVSTLSYRTKVYNYLKNNLGLYTGMDETSIPFTDMPEKGHWAYDAIVWAYTSTPQITSGTTATTFSPNKTVSRAEAVTFLWCAAGKPNPTCTSNPFTDVASDSWYYKAVLWAVERGITAGTSATTFSPKKDVSLAEMLTFLWAAEGKPTISWTGNPFTDVSSGKWYYKAVLWAYYGGVLVGNEGSGSNLCPDTPCTRAYVVTYLFNYYVMAAP